MSSTFDRMTLSFSTLCSGKMKKNGHPVSSLCVAYNTLSQTDRNKFLFFSLHFSTSCADHDADAVMDGEGARKKKRIDKKRLDRTCDSQCRLWCRAFSEWLCWTKDCTPREERSFWYHYASDKVSTSNTDWRIPLTVLVTVSFKDDDTDAHTHTQRKRERK